MENCLKNFIGIVILLACIYCIDCQSQINEAVGCFNDRYDEWAFFWWGPNSEYESQSASSCTHYCHNQKFMYAALAGRRGFDCHCGNGGYDIYGSTSGCRTCSIRGENFECGKLNGNRRLLFVYKITIEPPPQVDGRLIGCWGSTNPPNVLQGRPFQITHIPSDNMTVDRCIDGCRNSRGRYAGLWKGSECWCGADLQWNNGRAPAYSVQCNSPCPGNSTETCGAQNRISIYRAVCRDGFYGLKNKACQPCNCENDEVCDKNSGQCPGLCKVGFNATDPTGPCTECPDGLYGMECKNPCNCNSMCDKVSGECTGPCNAGWMKEYAGGPCSQECPDGKYGHNCLDACNCEVACEKEIGACYGNCTYGWTKPKEGAPCSLAYPTTPPPTTKSTTVSKIGNNANTKWIGIGVGVGAAVLLAIVLIALLLRRRKRQKEREATMIIPTVETFNNSRPSGLLNRSRPSTIGVNNFVEIDTDPEGNNTLYPVSKLMEVMKIRSDEEKPFYDEFQNLPKGNMRDWDIAERHPLREVKNRFGNVFPYNENRIILKSANENDYINASYIKNYGGQIGYIAAQGPIAATVDDFLLMIWQENVTKVVMVTNLVEDGKDKCEQYWPRDDDQPKPPREIVLKKTDELVFPDYIIRTFMMSRGEETRPLKHYMFSGWSDHEGLTYASSILSMLEMVKNDKVETKAVANGHVPHEKANDEVNEDTEEDHYDNSLVDTQEGPWLVHCSAGVGRTGTFIALDYLLDQAKAEGQIDVCEGVNKLREQRINMVQSLEQYRFIYIALLKALVIGSTSIPCYNFEETLTELRRPHPETHKSNLYIQFEALEVLKPKHKATEITDAVKSENKSKNRDMDCIPINRYRPTFVTEYKGSTGYINAVAVKGYKTKFAFLATQLPLDNTRADFWCMVFDYKSPVIVSLQYSEEEVYWPQTENESVSYGEFTVQCLAVQRLERHKINKLTLTVRHKEKYPTTTVLLHVDWPIDISLLDTETLFAINDLITVHQHGKSALPVIIQCMFGNTRSGLICALNCLIDMINAEQQADVFQCVQHIRSTRPMFVHSFEQYKFLYSATVEYISTMESYANFKKL